MNVKPQEHDVMDTDQPGRAPRLGDGHPAETAADKTYAHPHDLLDRVTHATMANLTAGVSPHSILSAWGDWALHLARAPGRQMELAQRVQLNAYKVIASAAGLATGDTTDGPFRPKPYDHRFTDPAWSQPPFSAFKQAYLSTQDWWDAATDDMRGLSPKDADRARFQMRQALDFVSPSNFPWSNPEILQATLRSSGVNLFEGAMHAWHDMFHTATQIHEPQPEGFKVGEDLACAPGKIVYRNELLELIQYTPSTAKVHAEPILFVPAWIMKYYILDLSAHNSMVRYLVDQGFTVFMISWRNPDAEQADLSLEDYRINGFLAALSAINAIVPEAKVHVNGYCLGGTLTAIAAAVMARHDDDRLASITLMAAQVDFAEAGELLLFVDDSQVAFIEDLMWYQGYLDRPQMTRTFTTIRAEDLIYTRAVRRYFLGQDDLPTDLTVWNNDTTRMPARMHSEYLRGLVLENRLSAGRFAVEGKVVALKDIDIPLFLVGTETDHIAPWRSVYKTKLFTNCDLRFVLTKGGHNGGILSEPGHKGRHYRIGHRDEDALYQGPDAWVEAHEPIEGSWWPAMVSWLETNSSGQDEPPSMGNAEAGYPPLVDAPGTYIHQT